MAAERSQDLGRPQRDDGVGLAVPSFDAGAGGKLRPEVAPFGVEASEAVLDIGEAGPVLDMEKSRPFGRPGDEVRPPGELVVLEWLVDPDREAQPYVPSEQTTPVSAA